MRTALSKPNGTLHLHPTSRFNVVTAYEDFEAGKQAQRTYDFLVQTLGNDCEASNQMWKFDVLSIGKLREMAVKDAQSADLIIVSCRTSAELPPHVKVWIESWLESGSQALALVALFDAEATGADSGREVMDYLREVARRAKVEFFSQPTDWPLADPSLAAGLTSLASSENPAFAQRTLSTAAGAVNRDYLNREYGSPRWGINE